MVSHLCLGYQLEQNNQKDPTGTTSRVVPMLGIQSSNLQVAKSKAHNEWNYTENILVYNNAWWLKICMYNKWFILML